MTPAEKLYERQVEFQTRLGISCGAGEPTPDELRRATAETDAFMLDLEREELTQRVFDTMKTSQRDYELKRRFAK